MSSMTLAERAFLKELPESVNKVAAAINRVADSLAIVANAIAGRCPAPGFGSLGCAPPKITVNGAAAPCKKGGIR